MASQALPISLPYPTAQPSVLRLQSLTGAQSGERKKQTPRTADGLIPPGACSPLTASRINQGFPGNVLTFVSCVFNIGIRVFSASQNVLVQNTFYHIRLKPWLVERHGLGGVYYGSGRWGTEKTDVGLTSEQMSLLA